MSEEEKVIWIHLEFSFVSLHKSVPWKGKGTSGVQALENKRGFENMPP